MKKLAFIIIMAAGLMVFPATAHAVDYDIEQTDIHANLQENGNVAVEETHTYDFDGDFNGVTRKLIAKEGTQIQDVRASENGSSLKVEQDDNLYKVHRKGHDETVMVKIKYMIQDGVDVYSDLGQFYWPFFDGDSESDYDDLTIFIHPPEPANNPEFLGYDAAFDTGQTQGGGVVQFDIGHVDSSEKGDIRVAYDASLFPDAPSAGDKSISGDIKQDRQNIEDNMAAFDKRQDILSIIAPILLVAFAVYLIILFLRRRQHKRQVQDEVDRRFVNDYFIPKTNLSMPATIQYMNNGVLDAHALSASLLDLVRKGYVKETDEETFSVVNRETDHNHEQILIEWLFDVIGSEGTFQPADLETYTDNKDNHEQYRNYFQKWRQSVNEEVTSAELYEYRTRARSIIGGSSLVLIFAVVMFGIHELVGWTIAGAILSIGLVVFALIDKRKTVQGTHVARQWNHFSEKFADVAPDEWKKWLDDDQKRAFIYGLGVNNSDIQTKSETLMQNAPEPAFAANDPGINMVMFMMLATTFHDQFDQAGTAAAVSGSGGSPGTGGGVGGGGGGSGAF